MGVRAWESKVGKQADREAEEADQPAVPAHLRHIPPVYRYKTYRPATAKMPYGSDPLVHGVDPEKGELNLCTGNPGTHPPPEEIVELRRVMSTIEQEEAAARERRGH